MKNIFLLGFDARENWCEFHSSWSQERKDAYLLRHDIAKPLSTDVMVWPSVFDTGKKVIMRNTEVPFGQEYLNLPEWIGPNKPLWSNVNHLRRYLSEHLIHNPKSCWIIAIAFIGENTAADETEGSWLHYDTTEPRDIDGVWMMLGYDVSDGTLLSGLSNCGYDPNIDDVNLLRNQWSQYINKYHLIEEVDHAFSFKHLSDQRVSEHAPFGVYGIWLVEKLHERVNVRGYES